MSTAIPQIPPRPTRTQDHKAGGSSTLGSDIPKIPPRPAHRRIERSVSPQRESFARSPLNEAPFLSNQGVTTGSSLYSNGSANTSSTELPRRPSSVALPSIGQEGSEYAEVFGAPEDQETSPEQTRNVANDLKLHAPKPSLPTASAKQRVSTVTRTDSGQAAAFGIGKAGGDDKDPSSHPLKQKASFASQNSNSTERPPSSLESEHGIPEIGQQVPMYPNAGDVQAPSPSPYSAQFAPGIGFHNDGTKQRHHGRRTSGRGIEIPYDAYGKHGHGQIPHDRFEKAYYEKHPELLKKETGHYHGPFAEGRAEWAMSSEDLNKIVRDTASRGSGLGTRSEVMGTPTEQIGFQASEEYTSRISSPRPQSIYGIAHSNTSQTHVDSPLRKESFPADTTAKDEFAGTLGQSLHAPSETALESEAEDEDTIHVDDPERRLRKIYSNASRYESTEDLGPPTGNSEDSGLHEELGYTAPILASDEVAKEPFGWELQPAVSPLNERRGSAIEEGFYHARSGSASSLSGSRPTSRPGSIHGTIPGLRVSDYTPLEDLDEYEPLFPEEEKSGQAASSKKPLTAADRLKRPELQNRKFPSQDIWEDTPNSLQYTATVSTPQLPEDTEEESKAAQPRENETPGQAFARRQEELAEAESKHADSFLNREKKPWAHKSQVTAETRPGLKQRFPSRDIWEDAPDSLQLQTTVASPQVEDKDGLSPSSAPTDQQENIVTEVSPTEEGAATGSAITSKPIIPARPTRSKVSESPEKEHPAIPERPLKRSQQGDAISPPVPTKNKPIVPARPTKPVSRESSENVTLSKVASNLSSKSIGSEQGAVAAAAKPKPPVPSRPIGSKIAALQGGFMSDLNKRLQLGPQAPKKEEIVTEEPVVEKEKAPLVDARKGRARGPTRRAPAKSPTPATPAPVEESNICGICTPSTLWQIDPEEDFLQVSSIEEAAPETKAIETEAPALANNLAGERLQTSTKTIPDSEPPTSSLGDIKAEKTEESPKEISPLIPEEKKEINLPKHTQESLPDKQSPTLAPEADDDELAGSTATLKADDTGKEVEEEVIVG